MDIAQDRNTMGSFGNVVNEHDRKSKTELKHDQTYKRRINLLKEIEAQLSVNAYEDLVQDLCYELGSIYENMGSLKKEIYDVQRVGKGLSAEEMKQIGFCLF
eukprot:19145_1